jgi:hypothetical protein
MIIINAWIKIEHLINPDENDNDDNDNEFIIYVTGINIYHCK